MIEDINDEEEPKPDDEEEASDQVESSLEELLAKKAEGETAAPEEEAEDEALLTISPSEERVETLAVKVVPQQPTEFTCRKCFLVKHRSQLADKKKMICRDCA